MTKIPLDEKEVLVAILQRRGTFNLEKMSPESFPGCMQVTCHGKVEKNETFYQGLIRESKEELGEVFTNLCQDSLQFIELIQTKETEKEVVTYGVTVSNTLLSLIRLGPDSGGLVYVTADQVDNIVEISGDMKILGPEYRLTIAMFPDEIEAVKKAFEIFVERKLTMDEIHQMRHMVLGEK